MDAIPLHPEETCGVASVSSYNANIDKTLYGAAATVCPNLLVAALSIHIKGGSENFGITLYFWKTRMLQSHCCYCYCVYFIVRFIRTSFNLILTKQKSSSLALRAFRWAYSNVSVLLQQIESEPQKTQELSLTNIWTLRGSYRKRSNLVSSNEESFSKMKAVVTVYRPRPFVCPELELKVTQPLEPSSPKNSVDSFKKLFPTSPVSCGRCPLINVWLLSAWFLPFLYIVISCY